MDKEICNRLNGIVSEIKESSDRILHSLAQILIDDGFVEKVSEICEGKLDALIVTQFQGSDTVIRLLVSDLLTRSDIYKEIKGLLIPYNSILENSILKIFPIGIIIQNSCEYKINGNLYYPPLTYYILFSKSLENPLFEFKVNGEWYKSHYQIPSMFAGYKGFEELNINIERDELTRLAINRNHYIKDLTLNESFEHLISDNIIIEGNSVKNNLLIEFEC